MAEMNVTQGLGSQDAVKQLQGRTLGHARTFSFQWLVIARSFGLRCSFMGLGAPWDVAGSNEHGKRAFTPSLLGTQHQAGERGCGDVRPCKAILSPFRLATRYPTLVYFHPSVEQEENGTRAK